jgi:hypothetical protein
MIVSFLDQVANATNMAAATSKEKSQKPIRHIAGMITRPIGGIA